jgi:hypothetical protein
VLTASFLQPIGLPYCNEVSTVVHAEIITVANYIIISDYEGKRQGNRVVSLGEIPYYDPASTSRREALEAES